MFGFLRRALAPVTDDTLEREFDVWKTEEPTRCDCCKKMYPAGSDFIYVPTSASFYRNANTRQEMAVLCQQNTQRVGWCKGCIRRLPDDGSFVDKEDHRLRFSIASRGSNGPSDAS